MPASLHTAASTAAQAGREQRCRAGCGRALALMNELGTIQPYRALGAHAANPVGQSVLTPLLSVRYGYSRAVGARARELNTVPGLPPPS
jgi:hypothetical protein